MPIDFLLPALLVVLLIFMFWSSRRRMQKQKLEQEQKARETVPGAEVLLQGGLYGTIVAFDPDNLDQPALVEIAPGVEIKVHSQAILRVVTATEDDELEADEEHDDADDATVDEVEQTPAVDAEPDADGTTAPKA
ncbi:preprotein translocase subunit YajC [Microbacterium hominis]|uniref:Preprotein translocase subunit YajC n=1 Tax=Microbacterium hominis TaxID=162426 RepID=A0A7D4PMD5_9MICO|nr:preprotein translocase subunit YajC [Microbacterium hominis]QKJ19475.1 preprotein translocase subunit YajC [Microbacterium hominis]